MAGRQCHAPVGGQACRSRRATASGPPSGRGRIRAWQDLHMRIGRRYQERRNGQIDETIIARDIRPSGCLRTAAAHGPTRALGEACHSPGKRFVIKIWPCSRRFSPCTSMEEQTRSRSRSPPRRIVPRHATRCVSRRGVRCISRLSGVRSGHLLCAAEAALWRIAPSSRESRTSRNSRKSYASAVLEVFALVRDSLQCGLPENFFGAAVITPDTTRQTCRFPNGACHANPQQPIQRV